MVLVNSAALIPALLAANFSNARQPTGPRTATGKRRLVLNALKHGRYAKSFRQNWVGAKKYVEPSERIQAQVRECFQPLTLPERIEAVGLAGKVSGVAEREKCPRGFETKPICPLESIDSRPGFPLRIQLRDLQCGRRLAFWVPRLRSTAPACLPLHGSRVALAPTPTDSLLIRPQVGCANITRYQFKRMTPKGKAANAAG